MGRTKAENGSLFFFAARNGTCEVERSLGARCATGCWAKENRWGEIWVARGGGRGRGRCIAVWPFVDFPSPCLKTGKRVCEVPAVAHRSTLSLARA